MEVGKKDNMENTKNYIQGRISSILEEIDHYENEARENETKARVIHEKIVKDDATDKEVRDFLKMEYDTSQNMQVLKTLLLGLKTLKTMADALSIEIDISDKHKDIFEHIKREESTIFVIKSGKKEFVSELAEEAYNRGLDNYLREDNVKLAREEIKKHSVDNKQ